MSGQSNTYDAIEGSLHLHSEIADSMDILRSYVDDGKYGQIRELLNVQKRLADQASSLNSEVVRGIAAENDAGGLVLNELILEIKRALAAIEEITEYIRVEKEHTAAKVRILREGKRAIHSYARLSGR